MKTIKLNLNKKQFFEQLRSLDIDNSDYIIGNETYSSDIVAVIILKN